MNKIEKELTRGDIVWAYDYPTDKPDITNACQLIYLATAKGEFELKRIDNGAIVYFRYIATIDDPGFYKNATLDLKLGKMQLLADMVRRDIQETETLSTPSEETAKLLESKYAILAGIESSIYHAEYS